MSIPSLVPLKTFESSVFQSCSLWLTCVLQESDLVVITNNDINVKQDVDASDIILTGSSLTITDATLSVSDVKMANICVKDNECNPQGIIAAGQKVGVVVKRVGSSLAYDMVSTFRSNFRQNNY